MFEKESKKKGRTEFYFFSGKGGVGKTSMAAATALWLSKARKVLVISTDPAHSLGDSYRTRIGGEIKKLKENLYAIEIDPEKALKEYKEKLSPQIEKIEFIKGLGLGDTFDIAGMTPGIDEIAAFDKFLKFMNSDEYDIIIFDTAPTGHALRFLSLPDVLDTWVGKVISLRMKFSALTSMFKKILPFGEDENREPQADYLQEMKERIKKAKELLSDPKRTHFWLVMIAEQMSIYESERAMTALNSYGIKVEGVIVNQLIPPSSCEFCVARRGMQSGNLRSIESGFRGAAIKTVGLQKHEINGFDALEKLGAELYKK